MFDANLCRFFKFPASVMTILINLYCLVAFLGVKELRKSNYVLVAVQSATDLAATGVVGFVVYLIRLVEIMDHICKEVSFSGGLAV